MSKSSSRKSLIATHEGILSIGNHKLTCAVLEGGETVLALQAIKQLIGKTGKGDTKRLGTSEHDFPLKPVDFLVSSNILPFVSEDLLDPTSLLYFKTKNGRIARGCKAKVLTGVVKAYLRARRAGKLQENQLHIAEACELLQEAWSEVGLVGLIYEQSGYRAKKESEKLGAIFERYLASPSEWTKFYQEDLLQEMKRLKVPGPWGTRFNELIYVQFPGGSGFLKELDQQNPRVPCSWRPSGKRKHKHHQLLSKETGQETLRSHLKALLVLMKAADSWSGFLQNFRKAFPHDADDVVRILRPYPIDDRQLSFFDEEPMGGEA